MQKSEAACFQGLRASHSVIRFCILLILVVPDLYAAEIWSKCGAIEGGRISLLVIDPQNTAIVYVTTKTNGVFKSTDAGTSWRAANNGLSINDLSYLAIDPQNPATIYAVTYDDGVFKSTNGGQSWSSKNYGITAASTISLVVDPQNPLALYVGTYTGGVFKSTDGGESWSAANNGLNPSYVRFLTIDPNNPETIFASMLYDGLFKSTNGGESWSPVSPSLPVTDVVSLVIDPQDSANMYAVTYDSSKRDYPNFPIAVYKSINGGESWSDITNGLLVTGLGLIIDPQNPSTIYAPSGYSLFKTTDSGGSWSDITNGLQMSGLGGGLAIDPVTPSTLYIGISPSGVFKSTDGGSNWSATNSGLIASDIHTLSINPENPSTVYAGTNSRIYGSIDSCDNWRQLDSGLRFAVDFQALSIHPQNPAILYAGTRGSGANLFKSTDSGDSWISLSSMSQNVQSLAIDPQNPMTIYLGTYFSSYPLFKSTDAGVSWRVINSTPWRGYLDIITVSALAIDPQNPTTIYAASGRIYKTPNAGEYWFESSSGIGSALVQALAIDPQNPATVYAGTKSGVFKSTNNGVDWSAINAGLTATDVVSLIVNPQNPATLYAGTSDGGVYMTTDAGDSWNSINSGLTNLKIQALAFSPTAKKLYAGVSGGEVWVYASEPTSAITVNTNPAGQSFSIDGTIYISAQTFDWATGSSHTIAVASPQGTDGTRYVFANWSDAGADSHSITVPASATTYTANFTTQYQLTTTFLPQDGGTITADPASADGYYASNAAVQLTANAGNGYFLSGWSGDLGGSDISQTVTMFAPRNASATFLPEGPSVNLTLSSGGAASHNTSGNGEITQVGYARLPVYSVTVPYATAVFSYKQDGVTVTEAGVPASPPTTYARIFIDYRSNVDAVPGRSEAGKIDVNTGIAVVNHGSRTANVSYSLHNLNGDTITLGSGTIPTGNHFAKFIDQFNEIAAGFSLPADFQINTGFASLDISSDQPLSIVALRMTTNQRNDILYTTTPVTDLTQPLTTDRTYFAQFADGGGYTSSLILLNTSNATETGTLQILDNNGLPLIVNQVGVTSDSSFNYSIPARGVFLLRTDGSSTQAKVGWVRLTPDEGKPTPVGSGVFSYISDGVLVSESGVPAVLPTTHARVYVDLSGNHNTGLAIANLEASGASITINAFQKDGVTPIGTSQGPLQLAGNGHDAKFADELFSGLPAGFTGVLDISSTTPFAALTIRSLYNENHDFLMTTFPVADVTRPAPSPIVFPQIADGGGYVTEFILLSPSGASSSVLSILDNSGTPLELGD